MGELDVAGADMVIYMKTDQVLTDFRAQVNDLMKQADEIAANKKGLAKDFKVIKSFVGLLDRSGLYDIKAFGASSKLNADGTYTVRNTLHVTGGKSDGLLWQVLGGEAHEFDFLNMLPEHTAMVLYFDLNWQRIQSELDQLADETGMEDLRNGLDQMTKTMAMMNWNYDEVVKGLGSGFGVALTLDPNRTISIPLGAEPKSIPEPGLIFFIPTKSNYIYANLDNMFTQQQASLSKASGEAAGLAWNQMSMSVPVPLPMPVSPTLTTSDDFLLITSTPQLATTMLDVKAGKVSGLVANENFKSMSEDIGLNGNQVAYIDQQASDLFQDIQQAISSMQARMKTVVGAPSMTTNVPAMFGVTSISSSGSKGVSRSAESGVESTLGALLDIPIKLGQVGLMAMQQKGSTSSVSSVNNLKQLGLGMLMYSGDNDGHFPKTDGVAGLQDIVEGRYLGYGRVFVHPFNGTNGPANMDEMTESNVDYAYIGGGLKDDNNNATLMPITIEKPGIPDGRTAVGFIDGHVESLEKEFDTLEATMTFLMERNMLNGTEIASQMISKAKALDAALGLAE